MERELMRSCLPLWGALLGLEHPLLSDVQRNLSHPSSPHPGDFQLIWCYLPSSSTASLSVNSCPLLSEGSFPFPAVGLCPRAKFRGCREPAPPRPWLRQQCPVRATPELCQHNHSLSRTSCSERFHGLVSALLHTRGAGV